MISIELLKKQSLFQGLEPSLLQEIAQFVRLQEFPKRAFVLRRGDPGDALVLMVQGRLQVISIAENGREVGINLLEPGDFFGEIALIDNGVRSASVVSLAPSMVGFLPRERALWHFHNTPQIAERIQRRLCATIRREIEFRVSMGGSKAYARVYGVLLHHRSSQGSAQDAVHDAGMTGPRTVVLENLPSQQAIASMANVSRETVSRALAELQKLQLIRKEPRRLVIQDLRKLEKLVNPD